MGERKGLFKGGEWRRLKGSTGELGKHGGKIGEAVRLGTGRKMSNERKNWG